MEADGDPYQAAIETAVKPTTISGHYSQAEYPEGRHINTLKYICLKTWLRFLASLPLSWLHGLGTVLGWLFATLPNRAASTTAKNLATCFPEAGTAELESLCRESLKHTACTALEMGKAWMQPVEKTIAMVVDTDGLAEFQEALADEKGIILLAPHLSNWEVFGFYASDNVPSTFMYQPPRSAAMDRLLKEVRSRSGVRLAPTNRKGVAQVLSALQKGEMVGILPDQVPDDNSGEFAPFFGEPAFTMTLISKLASRTNAHIFCGFAERLPNGRGFKAVFRKAEPGIYDSDIKNSVTALNTSVENCVRLALSQYQWEYKRFRRRPDNSEFY